MADDARLTIKIEDDGGIGDAAQAQSGFPNPPGRDPDLSFPDLTPPPDLRNPDIRAQDLTPPFDIRNQDPLAPMDLSGMESLLRRLVDLTEQELALLGGLTPDRSDPQQASGDSGPTGMASSLPSDSLTSLQQKQIDLLSKQVVNQEKEIDLRQKGLLEDEKGRQDREHLKKLAGFFNPFQLMMEQGGGLLSAAAAGSGSGMFNTASNLAAGGAKMLPGGTGVGLAINAMTTAANEVTKSINTLVNRGAELAPFSGELTGANVRRRVEFLKADIYEARVAGRNIARLTNVWTDVQTNFQRQMAHIKDRASGFLADALEIVKSPEFGKTIEDAAKMPGPGGLAMKSIAGWHRFLFGGAAPLPPDPSEADRLSDMMLDRDFYKTVAEDPRQSDLSRASARGESHRLEILIETMLKRFEALYGDMVDWRERDEIRALARDNAELGGLLTPFLDMAPAPDARAAARVKAPAFGGF